VPESFSCCLKHSVPLETKIDSSMPAVSVLTLLQSDDLLDKADRRESCKCTLFGPLHEEHGFGFEGLRGREMLLPWI
jgi:hypothetical protein